MASGKQLAKVFKSLARRLLHHLNRHLEETGQYYLRVNMCYIPAGLLEAALGAHGQVSFYADSRTVVTA